MLPELDLPMLGGTRANYVVKELWQSQGATRKKQRESQRTKNSYFQNNMI